jgi:hypothetical protein
MKTLRLPALALLILLSACSAASGHTNDVGLPGEDVPILFSPHIASVASPHPPYNSEPPTSGPHVPQTVAPGVYRDAIPEEIQVHALEHGHVLLLYGPDASHDDIRVFEDAARRHPRDVVVTPYPKLGSAVAMTAWGRIQRLDAVDRATVDRFITAFAGRYNHGWKRR